MRVNLHIIHKDRSNSPSSISNLPRQKRDPMRRRPPIQLWKLNDNNTVCPVSALQRYLTATDRVQQDSLLLNLVHVLPFLLSQNMVSLIKLANPNSFPHFHDIGKYAATLAFLGDATLQDLARCTGWRSIQVFLCH